MGLISNAWSAVTMRGLTAGWRMAGMGVLGSFFGGAAYVAYVSNAISYLSDDPKACINCHIMNPTYASWQHSSHARVAVCNDCHVPHDSTFRKYWFKANDGLRHSALFTLRRERQVIQAIPASKKVIQQNCIRCHAQVLQSSEITQPHNFERSCIECHREVPHGRQSSLSATPNAAVPPLSPVTPKWMRR